MSKKSLTPGSLARIYRDGAVLESNVLVPESGAMVLRHLQPGAYVARDDCGGEVPFTVSARQEETTVWEPRSGRSDVEGGAEPGASSVKPIGGDRDTRPADNSVQTPGFPNVGPERYTPTAPESDQAGDGPAIERRKAPGVTIEADEPVPGEPGAGIVHDDPEADHTVAEPPPPKGKPAADSPPKPKRLSRGTRISKMPGAAELKHAQETSARPARDPLPPARPAPAQSPASGEHDEPKRPPAAFARGNPAAEGADARDVEKRPEVA